MKVPVGTHQPTTTAIPVQHDDRNEDRMHLTCCNSDGRLALCGMDVSDCPWVPEGAPQPPTCPNCRHTHDLMDKAEPDGCKLYCPRNVLGDE